MKQQSWREKEYSAEARRKSVADARAAIEETKREYRERARFCRCPRPLPGRKYMKQSQCNLCLKLIQRGQS